MRKVGEVKGNGNHIVIKFDDREGVANPYVIYRDYWDIGSDGHYHKHTMKVDAFRVLSSAVKYVGQLFSWTE